MFRRSPLPCTLLMLPLLMQGCGGEGGLLSPSKTAFEVNSEPSGASVYVMGREVGKTPMKLDQSEVFPAVYDHEKQNLYGQVQLKLEGCEPLDQQVTRVVASQGINAVLDCGEIAAPEIESSATLPRGIPAQPIWAENARTPMRPIPKTPKERLLHLNELREDGLLSEEEYQSARKRILESL